MTIRKHPLPGVRKIAVLRANALGDYVFTVPALCALEAAFPEAEIVLLGKAWHRDFLAARPGPVDRVIVVPKCRGIPLETDRIENPDAVAAFFEAMRAEHFDIALQMHGGGGNSNPFVSNLGARLTAGLRAEGAPPLDIDIPYVLYHNEVLRYLEVAAAVGAVPVAVAPEVTVTAADRQALARELPALGQPYVVLHPGATDIRRRWPLEKMAALADVLAARGVTVCVTGVPAESEAVARVVDGANANIHDLCGKLSLPGMVALLESAELVVSNDTGPLHLARAVGTPTVGIYWMGNVINAGPVVARAHRYAISWTTHCPACGMDCIENDAHVPRDGCRHAESFVGSVPVDEVVAHAEALLDLSEMTARLNRSVRA
ncbi:MAG TPA: glycosyltransferase family 9 protein [Gammaproteobacteria bacterium]